LNEDVTREDLSIDEDTFATSCCKFLFCGDKHVKNIDAPEAYHFGSAP
jgi:hypothetical protein